MSVPYSWAGAASAHLDARLFDVAPDGTELLITRGTYRLENEPLTGVITVVGTVGCNVLGLGLALLVNRSTRFNAFMRAVLFYPYIIGAIIIGFLWSAILGSNGAINSFLQSTGADKFPFLSDPFWAAASIIFVIIWMTFGMNVILYLAGLQTIPESLIEAATIDGASAWQRFWHVKLALLAPVVTMNVVLVVIGLLRTYEIVLALTAGGPAGRTQTVVYNILSTSLANSQLGYGAAQSILLLIIVVAVTIVITRLRRQAEKNVEA